METFKSNRQAYHPIAAKVGSCTHSSGFIDAPAAAIMIARLK